jgi:hypothetical protein
MRGQHAFDGNFVSSIYSGVCQESSQGMLVACRRSPCYTGNGDALRIKRVCKEVGTNIDDRHWHVAVCKITHILPSSLC